MIRWIHLISFILVGGALSSLRLIVLPSFGALAPETQTQCAGAIMSRARRVLRASLWLWLATGLWLLAGSTVRWDWREIVGGIAGFGLFVSVWLLSLSPNRRLALQTQPRRRLLLDLGLLCAATLLLVACFR